MSGRLGVRFFVTVNPLTCDKELSSDEGGYGLALRRKDFRQRKTEKNNCKDGAEREVKTRLGDWEVQSSRRAFLANSEKS